MSIWTSKTLITAFLVSGLVSGCVMPDAAPGVSQSSTGAQSEMRQSLRIGALRLVGPSGFCPLTSTQQKLAGADFVAFVPCGGDEGAILAATIGGKDSAAGLTLKKATLGPYFATDAGLDALRGAGSSDPITVHEVADYQGAVVIRLTRTADGAAVQSWRALLQIDGRLITLSVRPRQDQTVTGAQGRRLITRFVDAMRGANAA